MSEKGASPRVTTHHALLITHYSSLGKSDSGLTRNTRCHCYRCSVPGLAGFTRHALCGARSLMTYCRLPRVDLQPESNGRFSMREHPQQSVDAEMQQDVNDERYYQRE